MVKRILNLALSIVAIATLTLSHASSALAAIDPCFRENSAVNRSDRNVIVAQNFLDRTYANADNVANSLAITIANLQARVAETQALASAAGATAGGNFGGCAVTGLFFGFGRLGGCLGRGIATGVAQRARADAAVRAAQGRLQSFSIYAESRNRREAQRIVVAQNQLALRQNELSIANSNLTQCRVRTSAPTATQTTANFPASQVIVNGNPLITSANGVVTITY